METSIEQRVIELRYAGVVIGKATVSGPIDEGGDKSVFVPVPDPLPVGTKVGIKIDDRMLDGRVIAVAESTDSAKCGMKVRIGGAAAGATSASGPANAAAHSAPAPRRGGCAFGARGGCALRARAVRGIGAGRRRRGGGGERRRRVGGPRRQQQ